MIISAVAVHSASHLIIGVPPSDSLGPEVGKKRTGGGGMKFPLSARRRAGDLSVDCTNSLGSVDTRWSIRVHHINSIRRRKNRFTTAERAHVDIDFQSLSALPWSRSSSGSTPKRVPWPAGRYPECWALSRAQAYVFECRTSRASVVGQAALFAK